MKKIPCPVRPPVVFVDLDEPEPISLAEDPEVENEDLQLESSCRLHQQLLL